MKLLRAFTAALLLAVVLTALAALDFARRTQSTYTPSPQPLPGVVFTGQFNRVHAGLRLLEQGDVSPLLISGTNPGAGIPIAKFAQQFQLSPAQQAALAHGTLVLSAGAANTLQNAQETRQWLARLPPGDAVVLITSRFHMPRASVALEQGLAGRKVLRYSVEQEAVTWKGVSVEFGKFVGTYLGPSWNLQ